MIADLINDHQAGTEIGLLPGGAFFEFFDQGVHGGEIDLEAPW